MCGKENCPIYESCSQMPYVDMNGKVTCGVYLQYERQKEYEKLPIDEKLKIKLEGINHDSYDNVVIHITHEDKKLFKDLQFDGFQYKLWNYDVKYDIETFIEISRRITL